MTGSGEETARRYKRRPTIPIGVEFPVTPMLDMAFQLLSFFILTFQAPTAETHLDLYLPATPAALPGAPRGQSNQALPRRADQDLENDLIIRAKSDELGSLTSLSLGDAPMEDLPTLSRKLTQYANLMRGKPLRVRLLADDRLRYEEAARIVGVCSTVGVASIRLSGPTPEIGAKP